jgi:hypothetical protein
LIGVHELVRRIRHASRGHISFAFWHLLRGKRVRELAVNAMCVDVDDAIGGNEISQHASMALEKAAIDHEHAAGSPDPLAHCRMRDEERLGVTRSSASLIFGGDHIGRHACDFAADASSFAGEHWYAPVRNLLKRVSLPGRTGSGYTINGKGKSGCLRSHSRLRYCATDQGGLRPLSLRGRPQPHPQRAPRAKKARAIRPKKISGRRHQLQVQIVFMFVLSIELTGFFPGQTC